MEQVKLYRFWDTWIVNSNPIDNFLKGKKRKKKWGRETERGQQCTVALLVELGLELDPQNKQIKQNGNI